jgi:hypothetical protein
MNVQDQISLVEKEVKEFYEQNSNYCGLSNLTQDETSHIIRIGTSILCTKWKIGYPGGGFVQNFVDNNLMGSIGAADSTTIKGFKFFGQIMYNIGMPSSLYNLNHN